MTPQKLVTTLGNGMKEKEMEKGTGKRNNS
jgi:hypothetical protein